MRLRSAGDFIRATEEHNDLRRVKGADWNLEVGCLTQMVADYDGPALLFERFAGYPAGFRLLTNIFTSPRRFALAMGLSPETHPVEIVRTWKDSRRSLELVPPKQVGDGPVQENVLVGDDVDLEMFPAPKWHEHDGGRYIGTADVVVTRDPDSNWVNLGTYRACIHGRNLLSLWISTRAKHGSMIAEKYWSRGQACPIALVVGSDPLTYLSASSAAPAGVSEYDYAGALHHAPIEVVSLGESGLLVPAESDIVLEGEFGPPEHQTVLEGPFGEWPGYYAYTGQEPVVQVKRILHRNNPILTGAPPLRPPATSVAVPRITVELWEQLEHGGITDVCGVWSFCNTLLVVISIKQRYAGHAKQALLTAAGYRSSASMHRYFAVVDDDIDPANLRDVLWALCTRADPATSIEIVRGAWTSGLDPRLPPDQAEAGDVTSGRLLIDATKPYHWKDRFPRALTFSAEEKRRVSERWAELFASLGRSGLQQGSFAADQPVEARHGAP